MNRLLRRAWQRVTRRLGGWSLLALALLAPTVAIALWMPQLNRQADELRAALAVQADAMARQRQPVPRRVSSGEAAVEVIAGFPPLAQVSTDLEEVFAVARRRNLTLLKGEYQLKPEPNTSLVSYTATFPVRDDYVALKEFTSDVLKSLPNASLDELRMSRTSAGSGVLDCLVRFTFVYRSR